MQAPPSDPELDAIRSRHLGDFKEAFQSALSSLSSRDRTLLKLHFVDGLSLDEIGGLHRVHRATVARWIARCREVVLEETRLRLATKLRLTPTEMNSFFGLMRNSLDVSIQRLLERE
jgi:RNA polymerase sigma-70 factor, ECF subfamily